MYPVEILERHSDMLMKKMLTTILSGVMLAVMSLGATEPVETMQKASSSATAHKLLAKPRGTTVQVPKGGGKRVITPFAHAIVEAPPLLSPKAYGNAEAGAFPELYGSMIYNGAWTSQTEVKAGIYRIPTTEEGSFELSFEGPIADLGGVVKDGIYYATRRVQYQQDTWNLVEGFDIETGEKDYSDMPTSNTVLAAGLDVDPLTGDIYGICYTEDLEGFTLNTLEYSKFDGAHSTVVVPLEGDWSAFAIDSKGDFYGIKTTWSKRNGLDYADLSVLCRIDRTTGKYTEIGSDTGYAAQYTSGMTFDKKTDRLFYYVTPMYGKPKLTELNMKTGAATVIAEFNNEIQMAGLYVPGSMAPAKAPGEPTDISVSFPGASLDGSMTLTAPATLFDGTPATGNVTVHVELNGFEKGSATGAYGQQMTIPLSMGTSGLYDFMVYASNEAGNSPKVKVRGVYVGADTPASPSATLEYIDGKMKLSWIPVTSGINGGTLDASSVVYDVVRCPEMRTVATGITETAFSEEIAEPATGIAVYHYEVSARCGELASEPAASNEVVIGAITPPFIDFSHLIPDYPTLKGYTIIDANDDGITWRVYQGTATISYNPALAADDWMILPPLNLQSGKAYELSFDAYGEQDYLTERLEVTMGTAPTREAMTVSILPVTDINATASSKKHFSKMLVPEADGRYYIGFHGVSAADMYDLHVANIVIADPTASSAPAEVTEFSVTPSHDGALTADIVFKAPTTTIDGKQLDKISRIDVMRDGTVLETFTNPAPGASLSYQDRVAKMGSYTYAVIPFNDDVEGAPVFSTVFIGIDAPAAPDEVNISTTSAEGEVAVSWTAVTTDCKKRPINPEMVRYTLIERSQAGQRTLAEGVQGTSYTYQAVPAGEQKFLQVAVYAVTDGGQAEVGTMSEMIPVGTPYEGLSESGSLEKYAWITRSNSANANWTVAEDNENFGSQDGDGLFFIMEGAETGDMGYLCSGLVSLKGIENPVLTFCTFNLVDPEYTDDNRLAVRVREQGGTYREVAGNTVHELCNGNPAWNRVNVDLSAFAGKTIQFELEGTVANYTIIMLDNIRIGQAMPHDLAAVGIDAPAKVRTGEEYHVAVSVSNEGSEAAGEFAVQLYENGSLVETIHSDGQAPGGVKTYTFLRTMPVLAEEDVDYHAVIDYALDANAANNRTESVTVSPVVSMLPRVDNLRGESLEGGVHLTWSEPAEEDVPDGPVTQDFEDGDSFASQYGTWLFVDMDNSPVGGLNDIDGSTMPIPGITPGTTKGAFWVWDNTMVDGVRANSGDKYLFSLFRWDNGRSDEWAISPALSGEEQTISFYARSFNDVYPNSMEVYWSTGSLEPKDFVKVQTLGGEIPAKWTKYEAKLPQGARRFAIRDNTEDGFMLLVDDVTFNPGSLTADADIVGYNLYRDGNKVNEQVIEENDFMDPNVTVGKSYTYAVTVVYSNGESGASNECVVLYDPSGLDEVAGDNGISIRVAEGAIVVTGAAGLPVSVVAPDGKTVFNGTGDYRTVVKTGCGIYIVKAGSIVRTVAVK